MITPSGSADGAGDLGDAHDLAGTGQQSFLTSWAQLRGRFEPASRVEVADLESHARTPEQHILMAAIEIDSGRRAQDGELLEAGLQRFAAGLHAEQIQIIGSFADLAVLGPYHRRSRLLRDAWLTELGATDPAVRVLRSRSVDDARVLVESPELTSIHRLGPVMRQEMKRQIAWTALDAYIERRDGTWLQLVRSDLLRLRPDEAGYWEYEAIQVVMALATGRTDEGTSRLRRLVGTSGLNAWRRQAVDRIVVTYCFLAGSGLGEWMGLRDSGSVWSDDALTPMEDLGRFTASFDRDTWSDEMLDALMRRVESRPSLAFLLFLVFPEEPLGPLLARVVSNACRRPDVAIGLAWPGREKSFVGACRALRPDIAFPLLAAAFECVPSESVGRGLAEALDQAPSAALDLVTPVALLPILQTHRDRLSDGTCAMIDRGMVHRAVIDASSLLMVGAAHGGLGSFRWFESAVEDLARAGFREVVSIFDASIRHKVSAQDWQRIETLEGERQVEIVRGKADPHVIREFLRVPQRSWVVTSDDYLDWLDEFPDLLPFWFGHRLHFHIGRDDRVVWDRPLDAPRLPKGAPQRPRRNVP